MNYVVAVSGGVDSVALLDMMVRANAGQLVVAHFDHGIRDDSHEDVLFVAELAKKHNLPFETRREELGLEASEALARERRYAFLCELADKHSATIVTAHHLDDLVETVAINMTRGTGWRGLSVFHSDIERPLVDIEKSALIAYAQKNGLTWREDSTNEDHKYLRNRIRTKTGALSSEAKRSLRALQLQQHQAKKTIEDEAKALIGDGPRYDRYWFTHVPVAVAIECLRVLTNGSLTRPQLARALHAIKVALPGSKYAAGSGVNFHFSTRQFHL